MTELRTKPRRGRRRHASCYHRGLQRGELLSSVLATALLVLIVVVFAADTIRG